MKPARQYSRLIRSAAQMATPVGLARVLLIAATLGLAAIRSEAAVVTDSFLEAVAHIESSGGRYTVGDGGRAHGTWQMHVAAWKDTTAYRKRRGEQTWSYKFAHDAAVAKIYARDYLTMLENQLRSALRREPTPEMVYAAYNMGFTRFAGLGFRLEISPRTTQSACVRLRPILEELNRSMEKRLVRASAN